MNKQIRVLERQNKGKKEGQGGEKKPDHIQRTNNQMSLYISKAIQEATKERSITF